jgi:tetratricopeptide (TPR) repeat protein
MQDWALHKLFQSEQIIGHIGGRVTNSSSVLALMLLVAAFIAPALGQINATQLNETEWLNLGLTLFDQNRYNDSLQAFDKLIEIDPQNEVAWKMRGIDLGYLRNYNQALMSFERAAEINSSDAEPWYDIGRIYDLQGDLDSAIKAYNRATEIDPNYQAAWFHKDQDMDAMGIGHSSLYNELTGHAS